MKRGSKQSAATLALMRKNAREWWAKPENRSSRIGGKLTLEHREKLRQAKLRNPVRYWQGKIRPTPSAETIAKRVLALIGRDTMPTETRKRLADERRGVSRSRETVAKMTATMRTPVLRALMASHTKGKPCRHSKHPAYYLGRRFRSTFETRVAAALDMLGIQWEYETRRFDCGAFTYCPDFYLPDSDAFWEVKGWYGPDSRRKVEAFRRMYPDLVLVVFTEECIITLEAAVTNRMRRQDTWQHKPFEWGHGSVMDRSKPALIDSNAANANEGQGGVMNLQAERLSALASYQDDAIVRSHGNRNRESCAEMTQPGASR